MPRFEFIGDSNEEISDVKNIDECRSLCLAATLYECRSATYDSNSRLCRLTEETKRSAPSEFRPADFGIDYLENECADGKYSKRCQLYSNVYNFKIHCDIFPKNETKL